MGTTGTTGHPSSRHVHSARHAPPSAVSSHARPGSHRVIAVALPSLSSSVTVSAHLMRLRRLSHTAALQSAARATICTCPVSLSGYAVRKLQECLYAEVMACPIMGTRPTRSARSTTPGSVAPCRMSKPARLLLSARLVTALRGQSTGHCARLATDSGMLPATSWRISRPS